MQITCMPQAAAAVPSPSSCGNARVDATPERTPHFGAAVAAAPARASTASGSRQSYISSISRACVFDKTCHEPGKLSFQCRKAWLEVGRSRNLPVEELVPSASLSEDDNNYTQVELDQIAECDAEGFGSLRRAYYARQSTIDYSSWYWFDRMMVRFVINPHKTHRQVWDLCSLLMITYDLITIPMSIGTLVDLNAHTLTVVMFWITLLFWSLDLPLTMVTGYSIPNGFEHRVSSIMWLYFRTWFLPDICVIGLDWAFIVLDRTAYGSSRTARMTKVMRILRAARSVRLLRLAKLKGLLEAVQDVMPNEHTRITVEVLKQIVVIVAMAHYIACAWYGIGYGQSDVGDSGDIGWVYRYNLTDKSLAYKYLTSMHWALTQFTPATMEVVPCNTYERFYTLAVLLFAMIVFSTFISTLTQLTARMRSLSEHSEIQASMLRRYLRAANVSEGLQTRIKNVAADFTSLDTSCVHESSVDALQCLSRPLRTELKLATSKSLFEEHPFFTHMVQHFCHPARELCSLALRRLFFCRGDEVFTQGERNDTISIMFIERGMLTYHQAFEGCSMYAPRVDGLKARLRCREWCCEASLWTEHWVHMGTLLVAGSCEVVGICPKEFVRIAERHTQFRFLAVQYALQYVNHLNGCTAADISDAPYRDETVLQELFEKSMVHSEKELTRQWLGRSSF
eukprot:NODE_1463_length_2468_cov_16.357540.p1 GENE.NODE_1463_length_2468_cov_16.357540~~NODE_1463_length_2468_cov_16.357540.p1  ORF type:complete len:681 (-),score=176.76 NODE_1463_length_2468_cov_16.357540:426-2468(-)